MCFQTQMKLYKATNSVVVDNMQNSNQCMKVATTFTFAQSEDEQIP